MRWRAFRSSSTGTNALPEDPSQASARANADILRRQEPHEEDDEDEDERNVTNDEGDEDEEDGDGYSE
jgi:hypothetical protein